MNDILDSLKAEFITIHDSGKAYVVRVWHVVAIAFVVGWLLG